MRRINELVRGKRGVTPETAWLLAGAVLSCCRAFVFRRGRQTDRQQSTSVTPQSGRYGFADTLKRQARRSTPVRTSSRRLWLVS